MKKIVFLLCGVLCSALACAKIDHERLLNAYLEGHLEPWQQTIDNDNTSNIDTLVELVNYEYGYIGFCLGCERTAEAQSRIATLRAHLNTLEQHGYDEAMLCLFRSAACAFELSMNHWKFATLGIESVRLANRALELAPDNPFVLSLKGNTDFYRPAMAGGSKKHAIEYYAKAVTQYEAQGLTSHWNYAATLLTLAQAYEKTGNIDKAKETCDKLLLFAPNFVYVRENYYPELLKK